MYVYCVHPAMSKKPKQLPNCLKGAEASVVIIVFDGVLCEVHTYTVTVSYRCSTQIRYQKSYILVSDHTVYSKNLSSQYKLTAQIEL